MNNVPNNWVSCSLEDLLITLESGSRPKGGVKGISDGTPSIGGEHLTYQGSFDWSSVRYVPEAFANSMNKGKIQTNDILIVKDGATTGKTAFVDEHFPFPKAVVNEHIFICRPSNLINPKFLFRYLTSKDGQERILENFKLYGTGSREIVKNTLQYILCFLDKYKFDELFPYGDLPVEAPKNNELFFSWLWEELFPGEIMDSSDVSDFFVNNNYSEPNSAYIK